MLHKMYINAVFKVGKHVLPVSSHFMGKFMQYGYSGVARWYKEFRILMKSSDFVFT